MEVRFRVLGIRRISDGKKRFLAKKKKKEEHEGNDNYARPQREFRNTAMSDLPSARIQLLAVAGPHQVKAYRQENQYLRQTAVIAAKAANGSEVALPTSAS